ncbi:ribosome maturation factor RimM [Kingella negevensis]|uniref:ribosome maturation factor RimM n=1 Tax=Kingella negevensis TaxID=1522312 RepID=UPI00254D9CF7|nr:ribosome maturation factor RimM [Kingella negevensis]MDK4679552.1 ribosome maturation factor RimM [Kingella negevensis]MDK4682730.1 ribosome maturation factor RimM [Kingella negevensis]MDK4690927.1 ribosome maturation factor RimM [Kingella negevensis]MDK4693926.1 ribosome maturation factor RimM [Kingella negevensis]MDK4699655.1 ribosome maturation factor RimM [Kingella negevensis]
MSDMQNWVAMGYIKGVFGVRGWVKVQPSTEYIDSLLDYPEWRLVKDKDVQIVEVEAGKIAGDELQVKFSHIHDRDDAALLRGYTIEISRDSFAETEEDEYYWTDLVGMQVVNREGAQLGKVTKLMETGAHDVLVIRGESGDILIPFVSHYIDDVNKETKIITVDWGLDY